MTGTLKPAARSLVTRLGLYEPASRAWMWAEPRLTTATRLVTRRNQRLIGAYLARPGMHGLHIGCGGNHLAGWLNTELCPRRDEIYLDATRPFPLPSDAFDFVYSEHMIEHIGVEQAGHMLRECFRILRRDGVIRIVTPDLGFLKTLLTAPLAPPLGEYVEYYRTAHRIPGPEASGVHVFNHFMRAWGHQFIYDRAALSERLAAAGFIDIAGCGLVDSPHEELRGLARVDRMPDGMLAMESMTLEGRKGGR